MCARKHRINTSYETMMHYTLSRYVDKRLELLDDLFKNINLNNDIQNCLKEISDSERIISKISNNNS